MLSELDIIKILATIVSLMIAIIGHEIMHGYVAYKYGDSTAKDAGRLSINPIVHVDPIGTILVPAVLYISGAPFLFGWAKPVPVNIQTVIYNGGYKAGIAVALAGVTYNFILAIAASILLGFLETQQHSLGSALLAIFLMYSVIYNIVLGVFNLWPFPPLDGSNALRFLAMQFHWQPVVNVLNKIEPVGMILLIIVIATPLSQWFFMPARWLINILL
ncbi:site-2 protease family protein [Hydrogenimonas thermophila]|uniref:site-2 protease family protein n=1 Tax=Hydrogenimonas thermophila TaxID=223786 RepID=UPI0029371971|nr:site-2 protease family protein [Hydrogenimonas thermophila]WOE69242.1 site-2 protease family protein [Hydrogenimonas thermophila]WOE71752.1 site-2 protease family protein [Hydrogenimonas thermophila]